MELIEQRGKTHGEFVETAAVHAALVDALNSVREGEGRFPAPVGHALDMICVKLARIASGDYRHEDHWRDIAGYAWLALNTLEPHKDDGA